jgi:hypothetical protein
MSRKEFRQLVDYEVKDCVYKETDDLCVEIWYNYNSNSKKFYVSEHGIVVIPQTINGNRIKSSIW